MLKTVEKKQGEMFGEELKELLNPKHPLYQLAEKIPWEVFEEEFRELYSKTGRPAKPVRLMTSLLILKQMYDLSDEVVIETWIENPYYQYFSGMKTFQWKFPVDPTDLVYFRKRIGESGVRKNEVEMPEELKALYKKWVNILQNHPATGDFAPKYGTAGFLLTLSEKNALPTKNFKEGAYKNADKISGQRLAGEYLKKNYGCLTCPIRCGRVVEIGGKNVKGPEYEILSLLGSNMLIDDIEAIIKWNYQLDLLGIDSISVGTILGFAAELNEKGLWKSGIEFGKKENIGSILEDIAYRRGIGAELAEGVRYLSDKYGGKEFAPHVKGLEMAAYEPRGCVGHGLGYATANRGACHLDGGYLVYFEVTGPVLLDPYHFRSKPGWVVLDQNLLSAISAGGQCLFTSWTFIPNIAFKVPNSKILSAIVSKILTWSWPTIDAMLKLPPMLMKIHLTPLLPHTKALNLATGMEMDFGKFIQVGARGFTLERLFNIREGLTAKDDTLAKRFTDDPQIQGKPESLVPIKKMMPKYYKLRGWDEKGVPTKKTLKKLSLDFVDIDSLKKA